MHYKRGKKHIKYKQYPGKNMIHLLVYDLAACINMDKTIRLIIIIAKSCKGRDYNMTSEIHKWETLIGMRAWRGQKKQWRAKVQKYVK